MRVGAHVTIPRTQLSPLTLDSVVAPATALVPLEKFIVPGALDGSAGRYRAPAGQCLMQADNDYQAIGVWLAAKGGAVPSGRLSATQRAYRKEAERLLLWAILERGKPLSSLSVEDASGYREFLADPPASWCGPSHHQRWSPLWRPLEGALSTGGQRQGLTILKSLFDFLIQQNYLLGNPFAAVARPRPPGRPLGSNRTLTLAQWDHLEAALEKHSDTEPARRLARAMRLLYATGLRLDEITRASTDDLHAIDYRTADGQERKGWLLSVTGKGERTRDVPVPQAFIEEFEQELKRHGHEPSVKAAGNQSIRLLARFDPRHETPRAWSASGLYKAIVKFVGEAANSIEGPGADRLRRATTHWLRHSHASHALQGRAGRAPVPIQIVQNNLGHASVGTTSGYLTTEREARMQAMEGFWSEAGQAGEG